MDPASHRSSAAPAQTKRGRLSRSAEFERVYRQGRSFSSRYFVVHVFPRDAREVAVAPRLGLSVSRKVGGAVERNRVKRLVREAFATVAPGVPAEYDVVVVARTGAFEYTEREGLPGVQTTLEGLLKKAPLTAPAA